ncbi:MAG TPA: RDD family protein [Dehalococcoidia bacterium]|nr:RDD family protein [Dehalococcoidia bacterium]
MIEVDGPLSPTEVTPPRPPDPDSPTRRRVFAALLDLTLLFTAAAVIFSAWMDEISTESDTNPLIGSWHLVLVMAIGLPYYTLLEVILGRTLGKAIFGIKVVRASDGGFSRRRALTRSLCKLLWAIPILGGFFILLDLVMVIFNSPRGSISDMLTGTEVVRAPLKLPLVKHAGPRLL